MTSGDAGRRWGALGGLAGGVLGGFTWVVVYGIAIRDPLVWGSAIAVAAALWLGAVKAYDRFPGRVMTLFGVVALCVVLIDWLYIALLYPRLPEEAARLSAAISRSSLRPVRPLLAAASAAGALVVVYDLLIRKR